MRGTRDFDCSGISPRFASGLVFRARPGTRLSCAQRSVFGFFPWAAFLFFGVSLGSLLRTLKQEQISLAMQWFAVGGLVLGVRCV